MIRQYAMDPACITSWDSFCRFMDQIGAGQGRLLVDFPSSWSTELCRQLEAAGLKERNQNTWTRIVERMASEKFRKKFVHRDGAAFSDKLPWIKNAVDEHFKSPFDGILARNGRRDIPAVMDPDDATDENPRWRVERTKKISMTAKDIMGVVRPLLRVSREVVLVDPYLFKCDQGGIRLSSAHWDVIQELALECAKRTMSRIEYHCGDWDGLVKDDRISGFKQEVQRIFRRDLDFVLCLWPRKSQHNRFVLTEVGGISFGHGLDENRSQKDDIALLDDAHWQGLWNEYRGRKFKKPSREIQVIKRT